MDEKNMPNLLDILEFLKFPDKKHLLEFSDTDSHSTFTKDDIFTSTEDHQTHKTIKSGTQNLTNKTNKSSQYLS